MPDPITGEPDPDELRRNLAITLGSRPPMMEHLGLPSAPPSPDVAAPGSLPDQSRIPNLAISPPNVKGPRGTLDADKAERTRQLQTGAGVDQIYSKVTNLGFGQNHPLAAKILGGLGEGALKAGDIGLSALAPALAINLPGTEYHHQMGLHQLNRQIGTEEGEAKNEAETSAQEAEVPMRQAETEKFEQQAQSAVPVQISKEQAESLGMPELEGESVSPQVLAGLSRAHQGNTTKEGIAGETNDTRRDVAHTGAESRERVAQTGAESRETVAKTQALSREQVAQINGSMHKALESMREASPLAKGNAGPTMTTRAMAEMAQTVIPQMHRVTTEVDQLAGDVGPAVGRWNDLLVNKGGKDFPQFAHLDTDLDLLASAIVRTHFGARGGQQYRQELRKMFGESQSPEDLKERIAAAEDWIQGYANAGHPHQPGGSTGAGEMIRARDPQGKLHEAPKGTALPKGWKAE